MRTLELEEGKENKLMILPCKNEGKVSRGILYMAFIYNSEHNYANSAHTFLHLSIN